MPPRGSEGLDFTPILTHYLFLFTSVLAIVSLPSSIEIIRHVHPQSGCMVCHFCFSDFCRSSYVFVHNSQKSDFDITRDFQAALRATSGLLYFLNYSSLSASFTPSQQMQYQCIVSKYLYLAQLLSCFP